MKRALAPTDGGLILLRQLDERWGPVMSLPITAC